MARLLLQQSCSRQGLQGPWSCSTAPFEPRRSPGGPIFPELPGANAGRSRNLDHCLSTCSLVFTDGSKTAADHRSAPAAVASTGAPR